MSVKASEAENLLCLTLTLAQVTENLGGKAAEAENLRVEMAVVVQAKSEVSEALACIQTEYNMYKQQVPPRFDHPLVPLSFSLSGLE